MFKRVVIDAGHGGNDPGTVGSGLKEKDINLLVAKEIGVFLEKRYKDIKVTMTRDSDVFLSLRDRCLIANKAQADLFISIHVNDHTTATATGYEDYILNTLSDTGRTAEIRNIIHRNIAAILKVKNRGKKRANFQVLRDTTMPAVLLEIAFIKADGELLKSKVYLSSFSEAVAKGIAESLNVVESKVVANACKGE